LEDGAPQSIASFAAIDLPFVKRDTHRAAPEATLASADVRGKQLSIFGFSNLAVPHDVMEREYLRLLSEAMAGRVRLEIETRPFADLAAAWERQRAGPGVKLVLVP
jgi:hypothetical protein